MRFAVKELRDAIVAFYREGHTEAEIVRLAPSLSSTHQIGSVWNTVNQSLVNRWLSKARDADPDVVIWHHLNRRRREPGVYTNWRRDGLILLAHYYDPVTDTLYLSEGMDFTPAPGSRPPRNVKGYKKIENRGPGMRDSDAVGPYVAELHDGFGYSSRDIVKLWKKRKTRQPATDREPRVMWLAEQLRGVKPIALGHTTIHRILKTYGYIKRPNLESGEQGDT